MLHSPCALPAQARVMKLVVTSYFDSVTSREDGSRDGKKSWSLFDTELIFSQ